MFSLLLAIIYIAFVSLGLPDSLLGSAWPVMHSQLGVPLSYAGIVTMIIAGGTIVSSLLSDRLTRKLGTGLVTAISVLLTAAALFGFSISKSFIMLCLWAVPYGFGAGAVDAALNNYVALHYASRHMSWLHCFWGVGAAISPYIMSYNLTTELGWSGGYFFIAILQVSLTAVLFISLPLWKRRNMQDTAGEVNAVKLSLLQAVGIKGVKFMLLAFFSYVALESTTGLWASSYLVQYRNISPETAAQFASLYYLGITIGRFISGFIAEKVGDRRLIRFGALIMILGIVLVGLPAESTVWPLIGILVVGFGGAPIYPSIIHATPDNFGAKNSQAVIGIQMASAYVGSTFMPPLFGVVAQYVNIGLYPIYLMLFAILLLIMSEKLVRVLESAG